MFRLYASISMCEASVFFRYFVSVSLHPSETPDSVELSRLLARKEIPIRSKFAGIPSSIRCRSGDTMVYPDWRSNGNPEASGVYPDCIFLFLPRLLCHPDEGGISIIHFRNLSKKSNRPPDFYVKNRRA